MAEIEETTGLEVVAMSHLQTFQVFPYLPEALRFLSTLSRNLWWTWHRDAKELFRRMDPKLWDQAGENPVRFSTFLSQSHLERLARDAGFLAHQERVRKSFEQDISREGEKEEGLFGFRGKIAYFSMEFGLHVSLPLFAGGLGVLAGDHLKAASDKKYPLVGVGLLYRQGYFEQYLNQDGWQQEAYPETDLFYLPMKRAKTPDGKDVLVSIEGPMGPIHAAVWEVPVGRIPLFLLDTNVRENPRELRDITSRLYEGDAKVRLAQEMVLGMGGIRALSVMDIHPVVCHMNEGHSAFSSLERLAEVMAASSIDLKTALQVVPRTTVFTTHTPVSAGHDEFPVEMVRPYILPLEKRLDTTADHILSWGQPKGSDPGTPISMFVLGLRMAEYCNGVSQLHGQVARRMWAHLWPDVPEQEVPISHVTNGVHSATWISNENAALLERTLGPDWHRVKQGGDFINRIDEIYDEELWQAHEMSRSRLIRVCREQMVRQYGQRNAPKATMEAAGSVLDQGVLTIAFARRFAVYKRAHLMLQDPQRLKALLRSETRPIQLIFAGKAHPKDHEGKMLIQQLIHFIREEKLGHRVIFLENYDMRLSHYLVQGADVWLNTPRRPLEACGTSGMKAALNGVLNVSVLDGWWCEGYAPTRGWAIGDGTEYRDPAYQDSVEGQALYNILENEVVPCFYERKGGEPPERWLKMMKASMKLALAEYSGARMVSKYEERFYRPAALRHDALLQDSASEAGALVRQSDRIADLWKSVSIEQPERDTEGPFRVGETFRATVRVSLGQLLPKEADVELYFGHVKAFDTLFDGHAEPMTMEKELGGGKYLYSCEVSCNMSGRFGVTARVTPRADHWIKNRPGFIAWSR
jgi:starch phosphorylase